MTRPSSFCGRSSRNLLIATFALSTLALQVPARTDSSIPAAEFSRLIQQFSEDDGYFRSDNFTSNETSYLQVVDLFRKLDVSGGAYIGVGPEQNFTYIAKVRPRIAFIVDIRRQAMIQHLLYKAIFESAATRAEFLAGLLSRPIAGERAPRAGTSTADLLDYFEQAAPAPDETFIANRDRVRKTIQDRFQVPLSPQDLERLDYVYSSFRKQGVEISFRFGGANWSGSSGFPTLKDLILQTDHKGRPGNFLASEEDYLFVRDLQRRNRVIPVVGDFAGPKAFASVGEYLRKNGYTVSAFYTSNVEQFLFQNGVFAVFAGNVRKLPIDGGSLFIRSVSYRGQPHPANIPGYRTTTVLQKISVFLRDFDGGTYEDYWNLVTTHFIAPELN
jgi:hypothetical protein